MDNSQVSYTPEQRAGLLAKLREPFPANELLWRVTAKSNDKKKGRIVPYADKRSYTDRLTAVFGVDGWSEKLIPHVLSPIQREKNHQVINTGKIMLVCEVAIKGIGIHTSSGEEWADDENAMTRTEAQAFKRACADFGLGRYFYDVPEVWVEIDQYGKPKRIPPMPKEFLPANSRQQASAPPNAQQRTTQPQQNNRPNGPGNGPQGPQSPTNGGGRPLPQRPQSTNAAGRAAAPPPQNNRRPAQPNAPVNTTPLQPRGSSDNTQAFVLKTDPKKRAQIMTYASVLGTPLWENIITGVKAAVDSGSNTNELGTAILDFMERAARGVDMVRSYAQQLSEEQFFSILDHHQIETLDAVPTFTVLTDLVKSLMTAVEQGQSVAA